MTTVLPDRPRTLVVHKSSRITQVAESGDSERAAKLRELMDEGHISVRGMQKAHDAHGRSLELVLAEIDRRKWPFEAVERGAVESVAGYDLVMTVGGDGTVLDVSHRILDKTPLLGVNSDPTNSVGYFCAVRAEKLAATLDDVETGALTLHRLARIEVRIAGKLVAPAVLNDILLAESNPAATCRYLVEIAGHQELQRSSGMWISTPAGSTAAIRSAGGFVLPLESALLQYLVREPYPPHGKYTLLRGVLHIDDPIIVVSRMENGRVYLDGPHAAYDVGFGETVEVSGRAPALHLLGIHPERRLV